MAEAGNQLNRISIYKTGSSTDTIAINSIKEEFNFLHFGLTAFAVGWFWQTDDNNQTYSYNVGNPGTFLTKVFVCKDLDRAFILFANSQTAGTDKGLDILYDELIQKYSR